MKPDDIKACFEAIAPSGEQKEKILNAVLNRKKSIHKNAYIRYVSIAAAVMLFLSVSYFHIQYPNPADNKDEKLMAASYKTSELPPAEEFIKKNSSDKSADSIETLVLPEESKNLSFVYDSARDITSDESLELPTDDKNSANCDAEESAASNSASDDSDFLKGTVSGGGGSASLGKTDYRSFTPNAIPDGYELKESIINAASKILTYVSSDSVIKITLIQPDSAMDTIEADEIISYITQTDRANLVVNMGPCYAVVDAPADCMQEVYSMIKSCNYYN